MAKKRVALLEFPVTPGIAPLATAYLEAVASQHSVIKNGCEFSKHVWSINEADIMAKVLDIDADVYGISCYVWNTGLVRRLLPPLLDRGAQIILGGPQVMNKGHSYLPAGNDNIVVCNGEGEFTFSDYLLQLLSGKPNFAEVKGLSYYSNGELVTNPKHSRIRDLDELPSPFLGGYIDPSRYNFAVFESNRGCPFRCTYCYWGAATNAKVNKFSEARVFEEITWLCENRFTFILLADANFGILERDTEIARHLAECKKKTGFPVSVLFNSSKNTPKRVTEITTILGNAGLLAAQPVSMQTMSSATLKAVERDNIKNSSYTELQKELNEGGFQSFVEIIWPLPNETLASFMNGLDELCRLGADSFVIYPLMLINNVKMETQRQEFGLVTITDPDPNSEAEIVVATRDVTREECLDGLNLAYNLTCLYSFRGLRFVMEYLDAKGRMTYSQVAREFWTFAKTRGENGYVRYIDSIVSSMEFQSGAGGFGALGGAIHSALHAEPSVFDDMLLAFLESRGLLADRDLRLRLELDLLNRPLMYSNTPLVDKSCRLRLLRIEGMDADTMTIGFDPGLLAELLSILPKSQVVSDDPGTPAPRLQIDYRTAQQIPFSPRRKLDFYHYHCHYKTRGEIRAIEPKWKVLSGVVESRQSAPATV